MKTTFEKLKPFIAPLLASIIWGISFVAQKKANTVGAFTVNATRSFIAVLFLMVLTLIFTKGDVKHLFSEPDSKKTKALWLGGILSGAALFMATYLQQTGMNAGVEAGKSGFLTALYVVMVPVFGIFLRKKPHWTVWISVALAVAGLYFLCVDGAFTLVPADLLTIGCAFFYTLQILALDRFSPECNTTKLSSIMFLTCAVLSLVFAFVFERGSFNAQGLLDATLPILYLAIFSSGVGYTLQILAQRSDANPAVVSILLSMESVFSVIAGAILLSERLTGRQYLGCAFMFGAVILNVVLSAKNE